MKNHEIARVLSDIGDLLELKGENVFKIRAYQKAARAIEHAPQELEHLAAEGRLREVPGIGEAIEKKITELVTTGKLEYFEKLKAEFPPGVSSLLDIPGIGPKKAVLLGRELNIETIEDLEKAILDGKVAELHRMGPKTAENILRSIQAMRNKESRIPIGLALPVFEEIAEELGKLTDTRNINPAGSLRRFRESVGDIDIMGTSDDPEKALNIFIRMPRIKQVLACGGTKATVLLPGELQVDLRIVEHDAFGSMLQHLTGSKQHNVLLRERARRQGLSLSEYGITVVETGNIEKFTSEEAFYSRLGLQFIPPEIREGTIEIARAEAGEIPGLIEQDDIKGDLHIHTGWSDGKNSIEEIALAAKTRGYQYIAITDHSIGRGIARGLDAGRLKDQICEIDNLNNHIEGIRILSGAEVDIRSDGSLDLPDDILEKLDIVTGSIHSGLGEPEEQITSRIIKAMENPHVDAIGHPTCRLFPERGPSAVDIEAVFKAALRTGTALEINSMPDRLDLKDTHIYRARELGVKLIMNTDTHRVEHLDYIRFGIGTARRGWCTAADIINTRPLDDFLDFLKADKNARK